MRHEEELHRRIFEGQIESKRGSGCPRTTIIINIVNKDAGLRRRGQGIEETQSNNREERREYGRMQ